MQLKFMKSSQECSLNARVPPGLIIGPTIFQLLINDLSDEVVCNVANYDETRYSACDQVSDF